MFKGRFAPITGSLAALAAVCTAGAWGPPVHWSFDQTTEGEDVFWTSPTAVDNTAPRYDGAYQIILVEVGIAWNGIPFGTIDVTSEIPPEYLAGQDIYDGPLPILILDESLVYPEPPEDPSVAATIRLAIDGDGYGQASITDVYLGTVFYDLGPPWGEVEVEITSIRVACEVDVTPLSWAADVNADGVVDIDDLFAVLGAWGPCPDPPAECPEDVDGNGTVNIDDIFEVLGAWT